MILFSEEYYALYTKYTKLFISLRTVKTMRRKQLLVLFQYIVRNKKSFLNRLRIKTLLLPIRGKVLTKQLISMKKKIF